MRSKLPDLQLVKLGVTEITSDWTNVIVTLEEAALDCVIHALIDVRGLV